MVFTGILVIVGSALCCFPSIEYAFLGGIFVYGLAAGCYQVFCTKYINETAPLEVKGPAGALTQVSVTFGSLIPFAIAMVWDQF